MVNLHSAHMDPDDWQQPQQFRPERFLDQSGNVVDRDRIIPFSLGTLTSVVHCVLKIRHSTFRHNVWTSIDRVSIFVTDRYPKKLPIKLCWLLPRHLYCVARPHYPVKFENSRSSSGGVAIRYVFLVLLMTSYLNASQCCLTERSACAASDLVTNGAH